MIASIIDDHPLATWEFTPGSDGWIKIRTSSYTLRGKDVTVSARFTTAPAGFTLPTGTLTVETEAFEGAAMTSVFVPDGCQAIGDHAFRDCGPDARARPGGLRAGRGRVRRLRHGVRPRYGGQRGGELLPEP